jgi:ribulose-phosphate 3-epimerase
MEQQIALSVTNADFGDLAAEIASVRSEVDTLHLDVMDGHFVPNILMGPTIVASLRPHTDLWFDCHLMLTDPGDYVEAFHKAGADGCSVHVEANDVDDTIVLMRELGLEVGLGVDPDTPYEQFEHYLERIDMLLVMSVHPGFGGQKFMSEVMPKLRRARDEATRRNLSLRFQVDGGIDATTAPVAHDHGADTFVVGSAILAKSDRIEAAREIRSALRDATNRH